MSALVNDALALIKATEGAASSPEQQEAMGLLALVAGQDVEPGDEEGTWRIAERVAPDRMTSTVDPEARHMHKSQSTYRDGYKAHVAVEPETGLITSAPLTPANAPDGPVGVAMLEADESGLEVLADSAYGSGEVRAALAVAKHRALIKPIPLRGALPGGFTIDTTAGTVTCPRGFTVAITPHRKAVFGPRCRSCLLRDRCTRSKRGRTITLHRHHELLAEARRLAREEEFQATYRRHRPMVERSIAWPVAGGHRRVRSAAWPATRWDSR